MIDDPLEQEVTDLKAQLARMTECYQAARDQLVRLDAVQEQGEPCRPVAPGTCRSLVVKTRIGLHEFLATEGAIVEVYRRRAAQKLAEELIASPALIQTDEWNRKYLETTYEVVLSFPAPEVTRR